MANEPAWRRVSARTYLLGKRAAEYAVHGEARTARVAEDEAEPNVVAFRVALLRQWRIEATRELTSGLSDRQVWDQEHDRSFALVKQVGRHMARRRRDNDLGQ
ncbi:hypothetical protein [Plantactinospora sp. CA-290183]|uniref:hypothetical protein n=1 Tax=Plantactinospora sp. CA-290183 TaxID=3240006 RepID=UPI003D89ED4F